ncbi:MAG: galactokinase family protein [Candidatus Latescibacterota bacterium]
MDGEETMRALQAEVTSSYGVAPERVRVIHSPYRVCPLGAHVDHQLGQVTAMALDRGVLLAYAPCPDGRVRLRSRSYPGEVAFDVGEVPGPQPGDWGNYARGAVRALLGRYSLRRGILGITAGRLGEGGLSSSAAVGVAYLLALEEANHLEVSAQENIALDQAIENGYLGLRNGILDQAAILLSRRSHLTHIDCRDASHRLIPTPPCIPPLAILVAFSGLRQALVSTDYNRRVDECAQAARLLLQAVGRPGERPVLGLLSAAEYHAHRQLLTGPARRRAEHFFSEVDRVAQGIQAWEAGDLQRFGQLVSASGDSSIHNYECGCEPLIDLHRILVETEGVYGARFSGAGFRGCCVALVDAQAAAGAALQVERRYAAAHPDLAAAAPVLQCRSGDGAGMLGGCPGSPPEARPGTPGGRSGQTPTAGWPPAAAPAVPGPLPRPCSARRAGAAPGRGRPARGP